MAVSSTFNPGNGALTTTGDNLNNTITISRDATGSILINAGGVPIQGGAATVTNTGLIQAFGQDGNDTISLDETNGALPSAKMSGGLGNDTEIGGSSADQLLGEAGDDVLNGAGGADVLTGGAGNDAYFVDNAGDAVVENVNEGNDTVFSTAHFRLGANVENLVLQGSADLQGYGNTLANSIYGNSGNNIIDGGAGADSMIGNGGNDTFLFRAGEANGDFLADFVGNGAAAGDSLLFVGYGAGASFTNMDATHWQVNYNGGLSHDILIFAGATSIHASDYAFI
jgi:Ca2+-binding RTX toxin-like protein